MRCVRPDFTTAFQACAFVSSEAASGSRASGGVCSTAPVTATCTEVGNTSLEDCEALTWSLGCTSRSAVEARVASTSFMFMFELVPEPV